MEAYLMAGKEVTLENVGVRSFSLSEEDAERVRGASKQVLSTADIGCEGGGEPLYEYVLPGGFVLQEYFVSGLHLALRQRP
jgi:hypothetical protein